MFSTMDPKWDRSPSLKFNFDIYSKKINKKYNWNLTIHANYTTLIESQHNILFLIIYSTNNTKKNI